MNIALYNKLEFKYNLKMTNIQDILIKREFVDHISLIRTLNTPSVNSSLIFNFFLLEI